MRAIVQTDNWPHDLHLIGYDERKTMFLLDNAGHQNVQYAKNFFYKPSSLIEFGEHLVWLT